MRIRCVGEGDATFSCGGESMNSRRWLASVATILACVIVTLSAVHPVCAEDFLGSDPGTAVSSAAAASRVQAAREHATCQCDRCGTCQWHQLRFGGVGNATAPANATQAILRATTPSRGVTSGSSHQLPARAPPVPSYR